MSSGSDISAIRKDYQLAALDETIAGSDPIAFFRTWFDEAVSAQASEVNAMTLATSDMQGRPHARIVLLKGLDDRGFIFFTNYESAKGSDLAANPFAALVFFWKELERQVRVEGTVERVSPGESDLYFNSRPEGSRLGAWASPQSREVPDRETLEASHREMEKRFQDGFIPRPGHWGGYRIIPDRIEFWQGRSSRLHDRILFQLRDNTWQRSRLAP